MRDSFVVDDPHNVAQQIRSSPLAAILDQNPEGLVLLHRGRIVYANPAFAAWLGHGEKNELPGSFFVDHVLPDDRDALSARVFGEPRSALRPREAEKAPYRFQTKWGESVAIEVTHAGKIDAGGTALDLVIGRDASELRRSVVKMLLADRMLIVGTLAAGVAHEINNPLVYILGNLNFLAEELPVVAKGSEAATTEASEVINETREGAERVRDIVRDLNAFSRADHQSSPSIDVRRSLQLAVNMAWLVIRHRARLVKELGDVPAIEASEARLGQAFLSLLLDAAFELPEGAADKHRLKVATREEKQRVIVEISHTGASPGRDARTYQFDPFSPKGVGLAIAHGIIADLGGRLEVVPNTPQGTKMLVELVPASVLKVAKAAARSGRGRVLVVDDEPLLGSSIRRALREHEVTVVESGKRAILALSGGELEFDLILLDLMMPEMTGMDVYDWLRGAHPGAEERIVFMTGGTFTPRANEFLRNVKNERFEKPFEMEQIREFVLKYMEKYRT